MSKNELNNLDELLKSKLDQHVPPMEPGSWEALEKKMSAKKGFGSSVNGWFLGGIAASAAVLTMIVLPSHLGDDNDLNSIPAQETSKKEVVVNQKATQPAVKTNPSVIDDKKSDVKFDIPTKVIEVEFPEDFNANNENDLTQTNTSYTEEETTSETTTSNDIPESSSNPEDESSLGIVTNEGVNDTNETTETSTNETSPETSTSVEVKEPQVKATVTSICANELVGFEILNPEEGVAYTWSFDDGTTSSELNPRHPFTKSGIYAVSLESRSTVDADVAAVSETINIEVLDVPNVSFETEAIVENGIPMISFVNTTDQAQSYTWNFGDGFTSNEKEPVHQYKFKGNYDVTLAATNMDGCSASAQSKVEVTEEWNLLAPDAITVNGDGINDDFMPAALKVMDVEFTLSILSQGGGLIYESKSVDMPWNGINNQTGEVCPEGSYVWIVNLTNKKGELEQYKGALLLIRN